MVYWVGTRRREHGRNECARSDQSPPGWSRANSMMTGVIQYNSNFSTSVVQSYNSTIVVQ
eukprot:6378814-Pyramimonas_sp.AAC.1